MHPALGPRYPLRMHVALVGPELEENLGLRYIASSLAKAGVDCDILPLDVAADVPAVRDAILARDPAAVGLSLAFQWRALDMLALAVALRDAGWKGLLVGGGHFAAFSWRSILEDFPEIDALCLYEAEHSFLELLRAHAAGRPLRDVAGVAVRAPDPLETPLGEPPDLAALPWPDRRGAAVRCLGHNVASMVASRGCYARCAFCCIAAWHGRGGGGVRFRVRPVEDVADEMAHLHHTLGTDIFIFHDDDFFVPGGAGGVVGRLGALADALDARGVGRIATVVKARPNDVRPDTMRLAVERLGLARVFLGVETDAVRGLRTLDRHVRSEQNHAALATLGELGLYTCFNLLVFDPDCTTEDLETNIAFMERYAEVPFNFGRAELYAGTPLLARMVAEGRAKGDWLGWDYPLHDAEIQRVFEVAMRVFYERNFGSDGMANRMQGTRFDVEVARHFHPDRFDDAWAAEVRDIQGALGRDSAAGLRRVLELVRVGGDEAALAADLRDVERRLRRRVVDLEAAVRTAIGAGCRHSRPRTLGASP